MIIKDCSKIVCKMKTNNNISQNSEKPLDLEAYKKRLKKCVFSPEAIKAIKEQIHHRNKTR